MELFSNEKENRDYLIGQLHNQLSSFLNKEKHLDAEVPVPYKHIYLPGHSLSNLEVWCFKQDICLYKTLIENTVKYKDAQMIDKGNKGLPLLDVTLEKDSGQNSHPVGLPYVIIETKMGKHITTHELLAYASKVEMIKTIFPYVQYGLLFFGKPPARAYRHGVGFDDIMYIEQVDSEAIDIVSKYLKDGYKIAIKEMKEIMAETKKTKQ
jgi:hypothetical protein